MTVSGCCLQDMVQHCNFYGLFPGLQELTLKLVKIAAPELFAYIVCPKLRVVHLDEVELAPCVSPLECLNTLPTGCEVIIVNCDATMLGNSPEELARVTQLRCDATRAKGKLLNLPPWRTLLQTMPWAGLTTCTLRCSDVVLERLLDCCPRLTRLTCTSIAASPAPRAPGNKAWLSPHRPPVTLHIKTAPAQVLLSLPWERLASVEVDQLAVHCAESTAVLPRLGQLQRGLMAQRQQGEAQGMQAEGQAMQPMRLCIKGLDVSLMEFPSPAGQGALVLALEPLVGSVTQLLTDFPETLCPEAARALGALVGPRLQVLRVVTNQELDPEELLQEGQERQWCMGLSALLECCPKLERAEIHFKAASRTLLRCLNDRVPGGHELTVHVGVCDAEVQDDFRVGDVCSMLYELQLPRLRTQMWHGDLWQGDVGLWGHA